MTKRGFEICIEGQDGSGKSTIAPRVVARIGACWGACLLTAQPSTSGHWGRQIRQILRGGVPDPGPEAMAIMFAADRREQHADVVRPALDRGEIVVSDRGILSSVAYQHGVGGVLLENVYRYNEGLPRPRLCVVLDVHADIARCRCEARGRSAELFENRTMLLRAKDIYCRAAQRIELYDVGRVVSVDASWNIDEVELAVWAIVEDELEAWAAER